MKINNLSNLTSSASYTPEAAFALATKQNTTYHGHSSCDTGKIGFILNVSHHADTSKPISYTRLKQIANDVSFPAAMLKPLTK